MVSMVGRRWKQVNAAGEAQDNVDSEIRMNHGRVQALDLCNPANSYARPQSDHPQRFTSPHPTACPLYSGFLVLRWNGQASLHIE
jgi:hypothetical protein